MTLCLHPDTTNNLLTGKVLGVSSPTDVHLQCTFQSGFTDSAHCAVQYGTDSTFMNLPFSSESNDTGRAGDSLSVVLRERLNSSTVYYYTVSAVSGDITVKVRGIFTAPEYSTYIINIYMYMLCDFCTVYRLTVGTGKYMLIYIALIDLHEIVQLPLW